jgi:hypothetical protein
LVEPKNKETRTPKNLYLFYIICGFAVLIGYFSMCNKRILISKQYQKLRIEIDNYYLKWNEEKLEYNKTKYQR